MLERLTNLSIIQNSGFTFKNIKFSTECVLKRKHSTEFMVEQYSEYSTSHNDYLPKEEVANSVGKSTLYSVSQHVPTVNTTYGNICSGGGNPTSGANSGPSNYSTLGSDWNRERSLENRERIMNASDHGEDKNMEGFNTEKKNNDSSSSLPRLSAHPHTPRTSRGPSHSSSPPGASSHSHGRSTGTLPTCIYFMSHIAVHLEMETAEAMEATSEDILNAIFSSDELGLNRQLAEKVFTLWVYSPLLELQLKPTHKPYEIKHCWKYLLDQYSHGTYNRKLRDEPIIAFQRNVFFSQQIEEKIKDQKIIELLYEEARYNILEGRYPCESAHYIMLGGIQARIELGPYNPQVHSTHYFREEQSKYLPAHVRKSSTWTWLPISSKNSAEVRLLEQFKRIPTSATNRKLMRKYLEFCWTLPYYGAAFFEGQIEQPVRGLTSLMTHQDIPVLVAINARGVYIIDDMECTLLLGLRYEELSWDHAKPSKEDDPNCLPCLFLQFLVIENGTRVSKIQQIFSKQTSLMDKVIAGFVHQMKKQKNGDETDRNMDNSVANEDSHMPITVGSQGHSTSPVTTLSNKLSQLTLATFDEEGHCIGQMGSWSFGY